MTRPVWWTVFLMFALAALALVVVKPVDWLQGAVLVIVVEFVFIIAFSRGWWVADRHWRTNYEGLAGVMRRAGVPRVTIVPPGAQHHPFERLM